MGALRRGAACVVAVLSVMLSGCGGGGSTRSGTAEGMYGGAAAGGASTTIQLLILGDGELWAFYGIQQYGQIIVYGFVQGNATWGKSDFYSGDTRDFGRRPVREGEVRATYLDLPTQRTIDGQIDVGGQVTAFFGQEITWGLYDYYEQASVAKVSGVWVGLSGNGAAVRLEIGENGEVSGSVNGTCQLSGEVRPHAGGKNVFSAEMSVGPPCGRQDVVFSGVAVGYELGTGQTEFVMLGVDERRVEGFWLAAVR